MRAEIVPFVVDTSNGEDYAIPGLQGEQVMLFTDPVLGDVGINVRGLPVWVYLPNSPGGDAGEESIVMLAGNIRVTWTVEEFTVLAERIPSLLIAGRTSREAAKDASQPPV